MNEALGIVKVSLFIIRIYLMTADWLNGRTSVI